MVNYYLRREEAEQKCRDGEEVGFVNTWNNDSYILTMVGDKIVYKKEKKAKRRN